MGLLQAQLCLTHRVLGENRVVLTSCTVPPRRQERLQRPHERVQRHRRCLDQQVVVLEPKVALLERREPSLQPLLERRPRLVRRRSTALVRSS